MVAVKVEPGALSSFPEKRVYYVVLGGDDPGIHLECPRGVAEGRHVNLLPIVLTIKSFQETQRVNSLNGKVFTQLIDRTPDDPTEIIAALKDSILVTKLFRDKRKKIYALKVGKLTGIWYGLDWHKDILGLTKYKGAEFKGFDSFLQAMLWMLDKEHLLDQDVVSEGTDDLNFDQDDANYWLHYPDESTPPLQAQSSSFPLDPDPFGESASRSASPTKQHRRDASPSKQGSRAATNTWTLLPPSSPTKEKHVPSRAASLTKGIVAASSIERSASIPPPYASARTTTSSVHFAPVPASTSSNHGTPRAARQSASTQVGSLFWRKEIVDVSDDESLPQEARPPPVPSANELRRIFLPPVLAHDNTLIVEGNAMMCTVRGTVVNQQNLLTRKKEGVVGCSKANNNHTRGGGDNDNN